jgi:hypothetical protein
MQATNRSGIVFDLGNAIGEVLNFNFENGSWYRYDKETLKSTGQSEVVRYLASNEWDDSRPQNMTIGKGYNPKCHCCWLGTHHTEKRHQKNLDSLDLEGIKKTIQEAPIGATINVSFNNHVQGVYKKRQENLYFALPQLGLVGSTLEELLPSLLGCRILISVLHKS